MFGNSHYPAGCTVSDVSRAAGPDIEPPAYLDWCAANPEADYELRQRFAEYMGADMLDALMDISRPVRGETNTAVVRRQEEHQIFVGRWRIFFTEYFREQWREKRIPQ